VHGLGRTLPANNKPLQVVWRHRSPKSSTSNMEISESMLAYALLTSYNLAGCLMEHFALFYAWTLLPPTQPTILQHVQYNSGLRAGYVYVIPKVVLTCCTFALLHQEPRLWWSVVCLGISWVSSFLVQIPLQLQVKESGDRVALRQLVRTTWVRTMAMVGHCCVVGWALCHP
jgi:hypothetical protein